MQAIAQAVPLETYLHTSYRPDCDWIEGEIRERNEGQFEHSNLQAVLTAYFHTRREEWNVRVLPEQRVRVGPRKYRIPDIAIIGLDRERTPILTEAPLIVIEIMSPDDTAADLHDRCLEYLQMGVSHVWVFDPFKHRTWDVDSLGWHAVASEDPQAVLAAGVIQLVPKQIFDLSSL
ncbi:MAG: Uma2 family endonuclease [Bryobacteraceae bacterium]